MKPHLTIAALGLAIAATAMPAFAGSQSSNTSSNSSSNNGRVVDRVVDTYCEDDYCERYVERRVYRTGDDYRRDKRWSRKQWRRYHQSRDDRD